MVDPIEDEASQLELRILAVQEFSDLADRLFQVRDVAWPAAMDNDLRLLAINLTVRRQLESIRAALLLARANLGHLAVTFVRASLEEVMYLTFLSKLERKDAHGLIQLLAKWDGFRALNSQRAHLGDATMVDLWFTEELMNAVEASTESVQKELKTIGKQYKWGGTLPSGEWVADQADQRPLYDYLHSASSRAVHFSAGEILRRSWGDPSGRVTTNNQGFSEHLANFALHQLVLLFFQTWSIIDDTTSAGVVLNKEIGEPEIDAVVRRISALGPVPLVHAGEWNQIPNDQHA